MLPLLRGSVLPTPSTYVSLKLSCFIYLFTASSHYNVISMTATAMFQVLYSPLLEQCWASDSTQYRFWMNEWLYFPTFSSMKTVFTHWMIWRAPHILLFFFSSWVVTDYIWCCYEVRNIFSNKGLPLSQWGWHTFGKSMISETWCPFPVPGTRGSFAYRRYGITEELYADSVGEHRNGSHPT